MDIIPETKTIETPSGEHKLLVKSYITGADRREKRRVILNISQEGRGTSVEGIEEMEDMVIKQIVIEVDGSNEDIIGKILKFNANDYDFVIETVNTISEGMESKKE